MAVDIAKFIEELKEMKVVELNDLVKAIEEEFGVSAAAMTVAAGPAEGGAAQEEKTDFDLELAEVGPNKIKVIKVIREVTTLGLKDAKDLVEAAPKVFKEAVAKAEAEEIANKFKEVGAKVNLK